MGWDEGAPHRNEPLCWFLQNPASTMLSSGGAGILLQSLHESLHVTLNVDSTSMGLMYENPGSFSQTWALAAQKKSVDGAVCWTRRRQF